MPGAIWRSSCRVRSKGSRRRPPRTRCRCLSPIRTGLMSNEPVSTRVDTDQLGPSSWAERIDAGEVTLEEAIADSALRAIYIDPYGELDDVALDQRTAAQQEQYEQTMLDDLESEEDA